MSEFYNPYYFVGSQADSRLDSSPIEDFKSGRVGHRRHDRWTGERKGEAETHSGRIVCRLTVDGGLVVGAAQERNDGGAALVTPYRFGGKLAIPGSTLHGLISSVAEAASNSTLRVLRDVAYSRRAVWNSPSDRYDAVGMVDTRDPNGTSERRIIPLALPPLQWRDNEAEVPPEFVGLFSRFDTSIHNAQSNAAVPLRAYVDGYEAVGKQLRYRHQSFLQRKRDQGVLRSHSGSHQEYWYAELSPDIRVEHRRGRCFIRLNGNEPSGHFRLKIAGGATFLLGQRIMRGPISQAEFDDLTDPQEKRRYTRGVLRVLGIDGRATELPTTKIHEWFLPTPGDVVYLDKRDGVTRELERFERIAGTRHDRRAQSAEAQLPFSLAGARDGVPHSRPLELRDGDIVCFSMRSPDELGGIAVSCIWRKELRSTFEHFRSIDPELVPLQDDDRSRRVLTIAEQLFGFVAETPETGRKPGGEHEAPALALGGRVRCSGAQLDTAHASRPERDLLGFAVPLKVLGSPKAPSPAMYFQPGPNGRAVSKTTLQGPTKPRGRKFYVHHPNRNTEEPWRTLSTDRTRDRMRLSVTPIKNGVSFLFHIDFENLSGRELDLLCYALRPTEAFSHKLGLGKPIGLGSVRIDPIGLFTIDRQARYASWNGVIGPRYSSVWRADDAQICPVTYPREASADVSAGSAAEDPKARGGRFRKHMCDLSESARGIIESLEQLGNPASIPGDGRVMYPQIANRNGEQLELEGFLWFQLNDTQHQAPLPVRVKPLRRYAP